MISTVLSWGIVFLAPFSSHGWLLGGPQKLEGPIDASNLETAFESIFDESVSGDIKTLLLSDLTWLMERQGSTGTTRFQEIFEGPVSGVTLVNWIYESFPSIEYHPDSQYIAWIDGSPWRWTSSPLFVGWTYSIIDSVEERVLSLLHEAWHLDGDGHHHVDCQLQSDQDLLPTTIESDCDENQFGAYGIQGLIARNMALHCQNCDETSLRNFRRVALYSLARINQQEARLAVQAELFPERDPDLFYSAIRRDRIDVVRTYLDQGWIDVNEENSRFITPILISAPFSAIYELLLSAGADLYHTSSRNYNIVSRLVYDICIRRNTGPRYLALLEDAITNGIRTDVNLIYSTYMHVSHPLRRDFRMSRVLSQNPVKITIWCQAPFGGAPDHD